MPLGVSRSKRLLFWLVWIVTSNLFFSCKNEDCVSTYNNHLLVALIEPDTLETGEIEFNEKDTLFYAVTAVGNDSVFYDTDTIVSTLTLPVNPAVDMTTFELYMVDSISSDTVSLSPLDIQKTYYPNVNPHIIVVSYDRSTRVITEECGVEIGFIKLKIDEITFPVYRLREESLSRLVIGNEDIVNIEIFF
jgi:hypothetical protein